MEPERSREYDSHTLDLLFSGLISRPEFTAVLFKTFFTFVILGLHLGGLLVPFGWNNPSNIIVQQKYRKQKTRGILGNLKWGVLAPKEEDLGPPSSSKACRI